MFLELELLSYLVNAIQGSIKSITLIVDCVAEETRDISLVNLGDDGPRSKLMSDHSVILERHTS